MGRNHDPLQTAWTAPPGLDHLTARKEVVVVGGSTLLDVFSMVLAEVVAKVIPAMEGFVLARTPRIVATIALLLLSGEMAIPIVSLQVRLALKAV
jgi:hypothetical protein